MITKIDFETCTIEKSSDGVYITATNNNTIGNCLHLTKKQASELIPSLQKFVEAGELS